MGAPDVRACPSPASLPAGVQNMIGVLLTVVRVRTRVTSPGLLGEWSGPRLQPRPVPSPAGQLGDLEQSTSPLESSSVTGLDGCCEDYIKMSTNVAFIYLSKENIVPFPHI